MLDMSRILVCISGRKSGWFLSEGEEGGGAGEVLDGFHLLGDWS